MNQLFISGRDVTADVSDFSKFTLEVGLNESKTVETKLSEHFRFESDTATYKMLKDTFFSDCNGLEKELKGQFKSTVCGGLVIPLSITVTDAVFCEEYIEVLMQSEYDGYNILESTYWFDNDFGSAYEIPIMYFAVQPNFLAWAIILLVMPIRFVFNSIDAAIENICKIIRLGGLLGDTDKCKSNISGAVFRDLDNWLLGVGRWSCAPLIREILTYQCAQAGFSFQSSVLTDPTSIYYNLAMFDLATGEKGSYKDTSTDARRKVLYGNSYLMTVMELITRISGVFEMEHRIINGTLYIETKEFFELLRTKQIAETDHCTLFSYSLEDRPAFGSFSFADDYYDKEGAKSKKYYSTILEWNNPPSISQKGRLDKTHSFGCSRFMFDPLSYEKEGFFDMEQLIDDLRDGPEKFIPNFTNTSNIIRNNDLCLSDDIISVPKLIVLENNFNRSDAVAIKKPYLRRKWKQFYIYNYPMMYKESPDKDVNGQLVEGKKGDLTNFADKANPRLRKDLLRIPDMEIKCSCNAVSSLINDFHQCYISTPYGKGAPQNASILFNENGSITITFSEVIITC